MYMVPCAGTVGDEILCCRSDQAWGTTSPMYNGYWLCFLILKLRGVALNTHPHLAPRLKKSTAIPLLSLWAYLACFSVNFKFSLHVQLVELNVVVSVTAGIRMTLSFGCCLLPAPATVWQSQVKYFARCVYRFQFAILLSSKYQAMTYCWIFVDRQFQLQSRSFISSPAQIICVSEQPAFISVRWLRKFKVCGSSVSFGPLQTSLTVTTPCRSYCSSICLLWSGWTVSASPVTYAGQLYVWDGQLWYVTLLLFFPQKIILSCRET